MKCCNDDILERQEKVMSRTKKELKYFTIPQYEKEQDYLNEMHKKGWKLTRVSGLGVYHFEECTPADMVYQLDYNQDGIANKSEYTQLFADCGWEYLFDYVGYSYFRKLRDDSETDTSIFCDDASRLDMMRRVIKGRMLPLLILFFGMILPQLALQMNRNDGRLSTFLLISYLILFFVYVALFAMFGWQFYQYELKVLGQPEKTKPKFIAVFVGLAILSLIVGMSGYRCLNRESVYQVLERRDGYSISAEYFDELVEKQYDLEAGDEIWVTTNRENGIFSIVIGCEGKDPIFTGNGPLAEPFSVTVQEAGCYTISCEGRQVEGEIDFVIK